MINYPRNFKPGFLDRIKAADIVAIIVGSFILAAGIQIILVPSRLLTGGVTGVAIILNYISGWDVGLWYAMLNIPIFAAGYKMVSRRFAVYSLLGAGALSMFLSILTSIRYSMEDPLLAAIFGGAVAGVGSGIIFRSQGSTGGIDIISVIARKRWGVSLGQTSFITNLIVISLSIFSTSISLTLYSAISIFISSQVIETVVSGLQTTYTAMIISDEHETILPTIFKNLQRGCTLLDARGGYTGVVRPIIMVTVAQTQLPRLREVVFQIDSRAFIIVNESNEVYGMGFKGSGNDF